MCVPTAVPTAGQTRARRSLRTRGGRQGDGRYDVTVTTEPDDVAALSRLLPSRVPARS